MAKNAKRTRASASPVKKEAKIANKFIYCCETYKIWPKGACLIDTKYYKTNKPLDLKKIPTVLKRKNYNLNRFINLVAAPEEYLVINNYVAIK
jgi:hypothetical protein